MSEEEKKQNDDNDVEVIVRVNRLKKKVVASSENGVGDGYIDPESIRRAQAVVNDSQSEYIKEVGNVLDDLNDAWTRLVKEEKGVSTEDIDRYANRIKDMASTYGFEIMSYFSSSLRDFSERLEVANDAHRTIVKAHLDVMNIALKEKVKAQDDPMATELKNMLNKAIEKHSGA